MEDPKQAEFYEIESDLKDDNKLLLDDDEDKLVRK